MEMSQRKSNKIANMGILCATFVAFIHVGTPTNFASPAWCFHYFMRYVVATIAVPYFFIVSGYFIARSSEKEDWWILALKKRFWSLGVPFVLWSFALRFLRAGIDSISEVVNGRDGWMPFIKSFSNMPFVLGLNYFEAVPPLWYLRALIVLVVISPLILYLVRRVPFVMLSLLFIVYYVVNPGNIQFQDFWIGEQGRLFWRHGFLPVEGVFYFSVGVFLWTIGEIRISKKEGLLLGVLGLLLGAVRFAFNVSGYHEPVPLIALTIPLVMTGVWSLIPDRKCPDWLGNKAFPIYILHSIFCKMYIDILLIFDLKFPRETILGLSSTCLMSVGASVGFAQLLKCKTPRIYSLLFGGRM